MTSIFINRHLNPSLNPKSMLSDLFSQEPMLPRSACKESYYACLTSVIRLFLGPDVYRLALVLRCLWGGKTPLGGMSLSWRLQMDFVAQEIVYLHCLFCQRTVSYNLTEPPSSFKLFASLSHPSSLIIFFSPAIL